MPSSETWEHGEPISNFTPRAQQVLALARKEADRFNHSFVSTEHLLLGLIRLGQGTAVTVLRKMGVDLEAVRKEMEKHIGAGPNEKSIGNIPYTPRVKKIMALAGKEAKALNHTYVGTEHILLGLLHEGDGVAARILRNLGVNIRATRELVLKELDPNYTPGLTVEKLDPEESWGEPIAINVDLSKRYDIFCEQCDKIVVYRNALFKGVKALFHSTEQGALAKFLEVEQADGLKVFIAPSSIVKFCEHIITPSDASGADKPL